MGGAGPLGFLGLFVNPWAREQIADVPVVTYLMLRMLCLRHSIYMNPRLTFPYGSRSLRLRLVWDAQHPH